ncbi:hypothetical protein M0R45_008902 [Rubus argutus]|uniref:Uncharacterized protein n=1 Tax=Rubus argutus TaxID=59490 RepID=A0AAW1Y5V3_RUBAR
MAARCYEARRWRRTGLEELGFAGGVVIGLGSKKMIGLRRSWPCWVLVSRGLEEEVKKKRRAGEGKSGRISGLGTKDWWLGAHKRKLGL